MRILVAEDEKDMLYAIKKGLKSEGYAIDTAGDGCEAMGLLDINTYDALILDMNMPKANGMEVLKKLREENKETKVIILTANSEIDDKVEGLDMGANDYMTKPFHIKELRARLRALLRRQFVSIDSILEFGKLKMDLPSAKLTWDGDVIQLTQKEFSLLSYLMLNKDVYISSETLIEHIWNEDVDLFSNSIRVHIHSIRKKIFTATGFNKIVETLPTVGYKFNSYYCEVCNEKN